MPSGFTEAFRHRSQRQDERCERVVKVPCRIPRFVLNWRTVALSPSALRTFRNGALDGFSRRQGHEQRNATQRNATQRNATQRKTGRRFEKKFLTALVSGALGLASVNALADSAKLDFNGHSYQRIDGSFTWEQAKTKCESLGAHLATVTSKAENDFLLNNIIAISGTLRGWLGGTDADSEGTWRWITGETWSFTDWSYGNGWQQPDNGSGAEDHLHYYGFSSDVQHVGSWNDANHDNNRQAALCEWEASSTCDTTTPYNQGLTDGKAACKANPASCGIATSGSSSGSGHATFDVSSGLLAIPYVDVPGPFGGMTSYAVDMKLTNPGNYTTFTLTGAHPAQ
jgi:hypothetical protein